MDLATYRVDTMFLTRDGRARLAMKLCGLDMEQYLMIGSEHLWQRHVYRDGKTKDGELFVYSEQRQNTLQESRTAKPKLIGLAAKAGGGKDTVAAILMHYDYKQYAFAGPLKAALTVLGMAEPSSRQEKEAPINGRPYSYRKAAQTLGTEWARALDSNFWLNLAEKNLASVDRAVISDVRFPNEAAWVRSHGGVVWHIEGRNTTVLGEQASHVSEVPLEQRPEDVIVDNSAGLSDLHITIYKIMKDLK